MEYFKGKKEISFSIYEERIIYIGVQLFRKLGKPTHVSVLFDKESNSIIIKPYEDGEPKPLKIVGTHNIISKSLVQELRKHSKSYIFYDKGESEGTTCIFKLL